MATVAELRATAKAKGLKGYSKLNKQQLEGLIIRHNLEMQKAEASAPATETTQANSEQPASKQETQQKISRFEVGKTYTGNFSGSYDFDGYSKSYTVIKRTAKTVTLKEIWPASWRITSEQRENSKPFVKKPHVSGDCEVIHIDCCIWIKANNPDTNFSSEQPEAATVEEVKPADVDVPAIVEEAAPVLNEQAIVNAYNATVLKMGAMLDEGKNDMPTLWEFHKSLGIEEIVINEVFKRLQDKGFFQGMAGTGGSPTFYTPCREEFFEEVKRITALTTQPEPHQWLNPAEAEQKAAEEVNPIVNAIKKTASKEEIIAILQRTRSRPVIVSVFLKSVDEGNYFLNCIYHKELKTKAGHLRRKDLIEYVAGRIIDLRKKSLIETPSPVHEDTQAAQPCTSIIRFELGKTYSNNNTCYPCDITITGISDKFVEAKRKRYTIQTGKDHQGHYCEYFTRQISPFPVETFYATSVIDTPSYVCSKELSSRAILDIPEEKLAMVNLPVKGKISNEEKYNNAEDNRQILKSCTTKEILHRVLNTGNARTLFILAMTFNEFSYISLNGSKPTKAECIDKLTAIIFPETAEDTPAPIQESENIPVVVAPNINNEETSPVQEVKPATDEPPAPVEPERQEKKIICFDYEDMMSRKITAKQFDEICNHNAALLEQCATADEMRTMLDGVNECTMNFTMSHIEDYNGTTGAYCWGYGKNIERTHDEMVQELIDRVLYCREDKRKHEAKAEAHKDTPAPEIKQSAPAPVMKPRKSSRRKTDDTRQLTFCFDEDNEPAAAQSAPAPKQKRTRRTSQRKTDDSRQILILFPEDISDCKTNKRIAA